MGGPQGVPPSSTRLLPLDFLPDCLLSQEQEGLFWEGDSSPGPPNLTSDSTAGQSPENITAARLRHEATNEHGWQDDGGRNDPSMLTIVSKWMSDILGQDSQQPELAKISGTPQELMRCLKRTPLKDAVLVLAPTCVAKQEEKYHFNKGVPPPWWPPAASFGVFTSKTQGDFS
ncbi:hypothetical protein WJX77_006527 [Trebouxia sp. C0004]